MPFKVFHVLDYLIVMANVGFRELVEGASEFGRLYPRGLPEKKGDSKLFLKLCDRIGQALLGNIANLRRPVETPVIADSEKM
jgi:hypothetical protein